MSSYSLKAACFMKREVRASQKIRSHYVLYSNLHPLAAANISLDLGSGNRKSSRNGVPPTRCMHGKANRTTQSSISSPQYTEAFEQPAEAGRARSVLNEMDHKEWAQKEMERTKLTGWGTCLP